MLPAQPVANDWMNDKKNIVYCKIVAAHATAPFCSTIPPNIRALLFWFWFSSSHFVSTILSFVFFLQIFILFLFSVYSRTQIHAPRTKNTPFPVGNLFAFAWNYWKRTRNMKKKKKMNCERIWIDFLECVFRWNAGKLSTVHSACHE